MTVGRTWAPIVASLIIVLVSSGIRWLDSLGLTILLGAFVVSGLKLTRSLIGLIDEISRGLIGFFLVMVISGVISQLLTPKLSGIVSWLIFPLIVLLIAFIRFPFQDRDHVFRIDSKSSIRTTTQLICTFLVLSPVFKWAFAPVIVLAGTEFLALFFYRRRSHKMSQLTAVVGTLLTPVISRQIQVSGWSDFRWGIDEGVALAKSVFSFGIGDSIYAAGNPLKYQWLSLSFSGLLDQINSTDLFATSSRTIWIIGAFTLVLAGRLSINTLVAQENHRTWSLLLLAVSATIPLTPVAITLLNISAGGIQNGILITFSSLLLVFVKARDSRLLVPTCILGLGCVLIRSVHIEFVLISMMFLLHTCWKYGFRFRQLITVPVSTGLVLLYYFFFLPLGTEAGLSLAILKFDFVRDIGYESLNQLAVMTIGWLLVIVVIFLPIKAIFSLPDEFKILRLYLLIALLVGVASTLIFSRVSYGELHFLQVPLIALFPLVATMLVGDGKMLGNNRTSALDKLGFSTVILLLCFFLMLFGTRFVSMRSDRSFMYLGHLIGVLLVVTFGLWPPSRQVSSVRRSVVLCLLLLQFGLTSIAGHYRTLMRPVQSEVLRPNGLTEVGNWVRSHIPQDAIFATNIFISDPISSLPIDPCPKKNADLSDQLVQSLEHGSNYLPAAHIQRRFLAIGPEYGFIFYPERRFDAIRTSLEISCGFKEQVKDGSHGVVNYVLRYEGHLSNFDAPRYFTKLFASNGYAVYALSRQ
jgi:hypothetical protein